MIVYRRRQLSCLIDVAPAVEFRLSQTTLQSRVIHAALMAGMVSFGKCNSTQGGMLSRTSYAG